MFLSMLFSVRIVDREILSNQKDNYFCRQGFILPRELRQRETKNNPLRAICGFGIEYTFIS